MCIFVHMECVIHNAAKRLCTHRPTICLGATYVVAYTYGYDGGRISPTHCALIDAGLGDRSRQRRACSRPPAGAGSARIGLVAGSRPGSTADPGGFHQSRTTPPSGTRSCGDASLGSSRQGCKSKEVKV